MRNGIRFKFMLAKFIESVLECVPGKWSMFNREHAPQFFGISACRVFIPIVLCVWLTLDICLFNSIRSSFFLFFFFVWSALESTRNLLSVFVLLHILLPK